MAAYQYSPLKEYEFRLLKIVKSVDTTLPQCT